MDLTIIIVSFKSGDILERCLDSIDNQYPIIVVENSCDKNLKIKIEKNTQMLNVFCLMQI